VAHRSSNLSGGAPSTLPLHLIMLVLIMNNIKDNVFWGLNLPSVKLIWAVFYVYGCIVSCAVL